MLFIFLHLMMDLAMDFNLEVGVQRLHKKSVTKHFSYLYTCVHL